MRSYYKEATVGAIVILGLLLFLGGSLWLRGHSWNRSGFVPVYYENIGNLKQGAPVRISGASIGRVEDIQFMSVGKILVILTIDRKKIMPTMDATAKINSVGMLGDAVIDFDPGRGTPLSKSDTLHGTLGGGDLMEAGTALAGKAGVALDAVNRIMDSSLAIQLHRTLASTDRLLNYLANSKDGPTAELNTTLRAFQRSSAGLDTTIASLHVEALQASMSNAARSADTTLRSVTRLTEQLAHTTGQLDVLIAGIQDGKGTVGKLVADSMLYVDMRKALQSLTGLIDDLKKNPGKMGITVRIF